MTTGRINQVTILSGRAEAEPRPARVELFTDGSAPEGALQRIDALETDLVRHLTTIQLPPLSFPRGGPLHRSSGACAPSQSATWAPLEEDTVRRSHFRGYLPRLTPDLIAHSPSQRPVIHSTHQGPPAELTGLLSQTPPAPVGARGSCAVAQPIRYSWVSLACVVIVYGSGSATAEIGSAGNDWTSIGYH
jgi:hypothetical protein